jgi:acyl-CoA dehydrogenase
MNLGFSEEQDLLRQEVRKFLDEQCPLDEVRRIAATPPGYSPEQWKQLAELGWLGLALPTEHGGSGLHFEDLVVLLEETGRTLYPSPLLSSTLAALLIAEAGSADQQQRWLPALADGSCVASVAILEAHDGITADDIQLRVDVDDNALHIDGEKKFVAFGAQAQLFVVAARSGDDTEELSLVLVERDTAGVSTDEVELLDPTKRGATLHLDEVRLPPDALLGKVSNAWPAIARHLDRGAIGVAAEACGAAEGALQLTVQFAKDRTQFGQPIGHYQGVKHPLAERYVDIESLKSLVYHAAFALESHPEEVPMAASKAKAFAAETILRMGVDGIQLHGAVGYTEEYDIQLYLKRSKWVRPMFGDEDFHYDRVAKLGEL